MYDAGWQRVRPWVIGGIVLLWAVFLVMTLAQIGGVAATIVEFATGRPAGQGHLLSLMVGIGFLVVVTTGTVLLFLLDWFDTGSSE